MSVQDDDKIRLIHILWPQVHINRSHEYAPKPSKFDVSSQSRKNFPNDILMLWSRRRSHNKHPIHNFITIFIFWKNGIVVIRPGALWRPRHPISRSDDRQFISCRCHGSAAFRKEKRIAFLILRHGSKELDRSSATARSSLVMLSA